MKLVRQILMILAFVFIGEFLNKVLHIPFPGNLLGMVLLLIALLTGVVKLENVDVFGQFLLSHLALFFIPASVGILALTGLLGDSWHILLFISVFTTFIVMMTTAFVVKLLRAWSK